MKPVWLPAVAISTATVSLLVVTSTVKTCSYVSKKRRNRIRNKRTAELEKLDKIITEYWSSELERREKYQIKRDEMREKHQIKRSGSSGLDTIYESDEEE